MGRCVTNFGVTFHFEDFDAFSDGGARVVDHVDHGLERVVSVVVVLC